MVRNARVFTLLTAGVFFLCASAVYGDQAATTAPAHEALAKRGLEAFESRRFDEAIENLQAAIKASGGKIAKYHFELGRVRVMRLQGDRTMPVERRQATVREGIASFRKAIALDRSYVDPQRFLFELFWTLAIRRARTGAAADFSGFIIEADSLLKLVPNEHAVWFRRGMAKANVARRTRSDADVKSALADFDKAIELKGDELRYWTAKADVLKTFGGDRSGKKIADLFDKAIKANPKVAGLRIAYAQHLLNSGRRDDGVAQLRGAIECQPDSPLGHLAMARYFQKMGKHAEVLRHLDAAGKIDPTEAEVFVLRATVFRQLKQLDKSAAALARGVAISTDLLAKTPETRPADPSQARKIQRLRSRVQYLSFLLADVYLDRIPAAEAKQRPGLLASAKKCLDTLSQMPETSPHRSKIAGRIAMIEGRLTDATRDLERACLALAPKDLQAAGLLLNLYEKQGMPGKAEKLLTVLQRIPGLMANASIAMAMAKAKFMNRDFDAAEKIVDRILQASPKHAGAAALKTQLKVIRGEAAVTSSGLSDQAVRVLIEQTETLWAEEKREQALAEVEKLHKAMPGNLMIADRLINMYMVLGRTDSAKGVLDRVMADHPDNENLRFQRQLLGKGPDERLKLRIERAEKIEDPLKKALTRAHIYTRLGRHKDARQFIAKAAEIKPDLPVVIAMQFRSAMAMRDFKLAAAAAERAKSANPVGGAVMQAEVLLARNKPKEAVDVLQAVRSKRPDARNLLHVLGRAQLVLGNIEGAAEVYGILESNNHGDIGAVIGLAKVAALQGKSEANERLVVRAYRTTAGKRDAYIRSRYLAIQEKYADDSKIGEIVARREKLLEKRPGDLANIESLARLYEVRIKDLDKAEKTYLRGFEKSSKSLPWARVLASFYVRSSQRPKALKLVADGIKRVEAKKAKVAWMVLQSELLAIDDRPQAVKTLQQAIKIDKANPAAYPVLAKLYAQAGAWNGAVAVMQEYLKLAGHDINRRRKLIQYRISAAQYDQAQRELDALLKASPSDVQALLLEAMLLMARGRPEKALGPLNRILARNSDYASALMMRAMAQFYLGREDLVRADLKRARGLAKTTGSELSIVDLHVQLDDLTAAEAGLLAVLSKDRTSQPALRKLIALYAKQEKWSRALSELRWAKKLFPKEPMYLMMEAEVWGKQKQFDKSVPLVKKAVELAPESLPVIRDYLHALADAKQYDVLLTASSKYVSGGKKRAWVYAVRGRAMAKLGKPVQADKLFLKALTSPPGEGGGLIPLQIRKTFGAAPGADRLLTWAKQHPKNPRAAVFAGHLYYQAATDGEDAEMTDEKKKELLEKSAAAWQEALSRTKDPGQRVFIHTRLGGMYNDRDQPDRAIDAYRAALKIDGANVACLNNLAYLYTNTGRADLAMPLALKALKRAPNDASVLDTYGWVLAKTGRYVQARETLNRSIEKSAASAVTRYHIGWVCEKTGDTEAALRHYRISKRLLAEDKNHPVRSDLLGAIKRLGG